MRECPGLVQGTNKLLCIVSTPTAYCGVYLFGLVSYFGIIRSLIAGVLALGHVTHGHPRVARTVELLRPR